MPLAEFERAHLNRWTTTADHALPPQWWAAAGDRELDLSPVVGRVAIAVDIADDRSAGSIGIAAELPAGRAGVELIDYRPDTAWIARRAVELWRRWRPAAIYIDPGPTDTVADELDVARVPIVRATSAIRTAAAAAMYDDLRDDRLRHRADETLDAAVAGAVRYTIGDRWGFSRAKSAADVSPLNAVALARYALRQTPRSSTAIRSASEL